MCRAARLPRPAAVAHLRRLAKLVQLGFISKYQAVKKPPQRLGKPSFEADKAQKKLLSACVGREAASNFCFTVLLCSQCSDYF